MSPTKAFIRSVLLASSMLALVWPSLAAEMTSQRLINADKEPQNWLMNHRTYDGQRYSPLTQINKDNVKNLKLAYAVPLGGATGNEFNEATPLAEEGFIYITDSWGVLYKIDGTAGDVGRIVWRMDPKQERQQANRGAALWGNLVISPANHPARVIATDKTSGKVVWETNVAYDGARVECYRRAACGARQGHRRRGWQRFWLAGVDCGPRCCDRKARLAQVYHSSAGRARQRDLERQSQCLADWRRRRVANRHV